MDPNQKTNMTRQEDSQQPARPKTGRPSAKRRAAQRMRSHNVVLTGVLLAVILLFALINLLVRDQPFSESENRNLAQKPALSWAALADGSYFSNLTDWYSDQFFGRDGWISMNLWETRRWGMEEVSGVYLGKDHYLLAAPESPNGIALNRTVDAINSFTAAHPELTTRMLLAPDAATILKDKLPENAPVRDQLADIQNVFSELDGSIQTVDAAATLQAHAGEEIYYRTDHHWTSLGAKYVFDENTSALGIEDQSAGYDIYTVSRDFEGTLASKSGSHAVRDSVVIYSPGDETIQYYVIYNGSTEKICSIYQRSALEQKDQYTVFFGGNHALVEICTTANNGKTLLVFKDSYANCFMQFLIPCYEKIIMVDPRYYYDNLNAILNAGVTDVLYLYSADTFLKDTTLADVLESAMETAASVEAEDAGSGELPQEPEPAENSAVEPETGSEQESSAEEQGSEQESSAAETEDGQAVSSEEASGS